MYECVYHSAITLEIDFTKFTRGRGFWKFNSSLLLDPSYVLGVKKIIKRVVAQYGIINGDLNFFENASEQELNDFYDSASPESLQNVNLKVNSQTFLDILQLEIRGFTISFSSKKNEIELPKK